MTATLIVSTVILLILMGLFAPFETLGWWAGWYGEKPGEQNLPEQLELAVSGAKHYVVYLTGIGGTSPTAYSALERNFLEGLKKRLPEVELVDDVFPYAASNKALTGERIFSWFWRRLNGLRGRGVVGTVAFIINIRNLWQVLVSSDDRFGPLYNYATTQHLLKKLFEHGYPLGSGRPISLIGYSGGGQISTGIAPLLRELIQAPVHVISLGGVMSSNEDILEISSLTHLYGTKDTTQRLGYLIFPQRWPFLPWTSWNRARKAGTITKILLGPMVHTGPRGYLDPSTHLDDGQSYLDRTLDVVVASLRRNEGEQDGSRFTVTAGG